VTGEAGFIGSHVCDYLLAGDHDVVDDDMGTACRRNVPGPQLRRLGGRPEVDFEAGLSTTLGAYR
jgi:UDP-glucose 4-epimerase